MTIVDVAQKIDVSGMSPVSPNVYEIRPVNKTLADFWITTFGASDESTNKRVLIIGFNRSSAAKFTRATSYNDMVSLEASFYWDNADQILYVHLEHDQGPFSDGYQYSVAFGFSDSGIVYIDDIEYRPLILSVPSFAQQQDLQDYDQLSFISGSIQLNNHGRPDGELDSFITEDVYGNDAFIYSLDDTLINSTGNALRSDLEGIAAVYIEDYDISLQSIDLRIQDVRKAQDITIPIATFTADDYPDIDDATGDVIPLMYGTVREAKAIPTNDVTISGDVYYRVAILLTDLGTVQVNIDDIWTTVTPSSIQLPAGEFILSSSDGRDTNGAIRDCRVLLPEGIPVTYSSDIIIDLNERFLGLPFVDSFYDTVEWIAEQVSLSTAGWVFDEEITLFNAIKLVQNGSSAGFRYEINPTGQRTIRINSNERGRSTRIESVDILNRGVMPVSTDSDLVFAKVVVSYDKSFNSGKFKKVTNDDYELSVRNRYNSQKSLPSETMLNNQNDAETRALNDAVQFNTIPSIMKLDLMGKGFLSLRIFDIIDVEATPDFADADTGVIVGRQYYGIRRAKVLQIDPNTKLNTNKVSLQLLGVVDDILITDDDFCLITDDGLVLSVPGGE